MPMHRIIMEYREAFMGRVFTLQEASALMPKVQDLTAPVFQLAASLAEELQEADEQEDEPRAEELRERLQQLVESWAEAIRELGPEVKGLWLVDFDSGDGYWCWAYPEEVLNHWHSYEGGFSSRIPIGLKPQHRKL
jgi:hypothetical protein